MLIQWISFGKSAQSLLVPKRRPSSPLYLSCPDADLSPNHDPVVGRVLGS